MSRTSIVALALAALSVPLLLPGAGRSTKPSATTKLEVEAKQKAASHLASLPIYFEPNHGQTDPSVSYIASMGGTRLFLTRDGAVFTIQKGAPQKGKKIESAVVRMRTVNSSRGLDEALERLPGNSNYLIGRDQKKWVTDVPQYAKVMRRGVYPGVDLVFYGNQRQLEYDFVLAPGADPNRIELAYDGVDSIKTNGAGDLVLATSAGDFIQKKPKVYQRVNGKQTEVAANYRIGTDKSVKSVRFEVAQYDRTKALVIDPVIVFNAIVGSSGNDRPFSIAVDSSLNTYIVGFSPSPDFPLVSPFQSTFSGVSKIVVLKLNSSGSALVYSTFLGGEADDSGIGVAVDSAGNATVAGITDSSQYPTVAAAQATFGGGSDGVLSRLNAAGSGLVFSTYVGGSGNDQPQGVAVDPGGNSYIVGFTTGSFPVSAGVLQSSYAGGSSDCTVNKYNTGGTLVYSTYLGGGGNDACVSVAADSSGSAYVTGYTLSSDFPITNGAAQTAYGGGQDAFVTKINSAGTAKLYSTFFGGSGQDLGRGIAVDASGAAYITGSTQSESLPNAGGVQPTLHGLQNAFAAKVVPSGGSFSYVTYLGGRKLDSATGIAVDGTGNAYIVGGALSDDFPVVNAVMANKPGIGGVVVKSTTGIGSFATADNGIPSFVTTGILIDSANGVLFAVANGTLYESNNGAASWVNARLTSPVVALAESKSSPNTIYAYPANASYLWKTVDGGGFWQFVGSNSTFTVSNISVSPSDPNTLMAGSGNGGTYVSTNGGSTWTQASGGITGLPISAVAMTDSNNAVACGSTGGAVYRTNSGGLSWSLSNAGVSSSSFCTKIITDPNNVSTLYLSTNSGLYKSSNGGAFWSFLTALPVATPALAIATGNSNILVAGGVNGGVYRSADGGASWTQSGDLATTTINDVAISPTDSNTVYLATDIQSESAGFAVALNTSASNFIYSTFLGGPSGSKFQGAQAVAVDAAGNAYITGQTASPNYGATTGALNAGFGGWEIFVTKLSPSSASCTLSFTNSTITAYPAGGSYPIEVFAPSGCPWVATPNAAWLSLSGPSNATGSAPTRIVVAANSGGARSASIGFTGGQSITINQSSAACTYAFSPNTGSIGIGGGAGAASLSVGGGCGWNAVSSEPWLTISNNNGTGASAINYSVTSNPGTTTRSAVISVGSATFTLTQAAPAQPAYDGSVDAASCSGITGWVADRNRLNVSIVVSLWSGGVQIASTTANLSRSDVGGVLGDNGLHGFNLQIPAAYANGVLNTYQIRYETSTTQVYGSPRSFACGTAGANYQGYVDSASCAGISGWAADRNRLNQSITVTLWDGSTQIASTTANGSRSDVGGLLGDNGLHGFLIPIPSNYANGVSHTLQIRYETSSTQLPGSPQALTCGSAGGTNYTGSVDVASCSGISGWVADRNRLNTPITVSLWDGGTQIASTLANGSRSDVGAVIGDNGLHGFVLHLPSAYANGVSHVLQVHFETSAVSVYGSPVTLNCSSAGTNYAGYVDSASCTGISGWAADRNRLNQSILVSLWDGNTQIASVTANGLRSDVGGFLGDNGLHEFTLHLPSNYNDGVNHILQVRYETSSTQLPASPVAVTCGSTGTNYAGYIDSASCNGISGWAADRNRLNQSIVVSLWDGSTQIASTTANGLRSDVGAYLGDNGLHSFVLAIPPGYQNGVSHTLQIRYESSSSQLPGSPATLTCGSGTPNYTGSTDVVSCTSISGWAADRNALNTPINVSVYDGNTLLTTFVANLSRPDVGAAIGDNGLHGFSLPTPQVLKNGLAHTVTVRPGSSSSPLYGPQSLTCQ